jgi:catechol 2,3-dioxygenase-like lactoylglutathione lyase family enzyme
VKVIFIASIAIIARDPALSRQLFIDALGLPLTAQPGDEYFHSDKIGGSKHFGVWPLRDAAQACFGTPEWPSELPIPQASIEFEVQDEAEVGTAAQELEARGYTLLHQARTEPWGQTVARMLTHEGAILGISYAPSLH